MEDELAQFTNAEFLDFDTGNFLEQQPISEYDAEIEERARKDNASTGSTAARKVSGRMKGMDFVNGM